MGFALAAAIEQVSRRSSTGVIRAFFDTVTSTITYVIHDPETRKAALIDCVLDFDITSGRTRTESADAVIVYVQNQRLELVWILETHVHADHISAAPYIKEQLGGKIAIGEHIAAVRKTFSGIFNADIDPNDVGKGFDRLWSDGDQFTVGSLPVTVLHVPGHTPACVAYVVGDAAFVGDTMFMPDYGTARADFPGGDARLLFRSLRRLLQLPNYTRIFMCHDYLPEGRSSFAWETTVAEQKLSNIHAHDGVDEQAFVEMREARDATLSVPKLFLPAVQVNMVGGHFAPAENNGVTYLKIPVNAI